MIKYKKQEKVVNSEKMLYSNIHVYVGKKTIELAVGALFIYLLLVLVCGSVRNRKQSHHSPNQNLGGQ